MNTPQLSADIEINSAPVTTENELNTLKFDDEEMMSFGSSRWKGKSHELLIIVDRWFTQLRVLLWKNMIVFSRKRLALVIIVLIPCFTQYIWLANKPAKSHSNTIDYDTEFSSSLSGLGDCQSFAVRMKGVDCLQFLYAADVASGVDPTVVDNIMSDLAIRNSLSIGVHVKRIANRDMGKIYRQQFRASAIWAMDTKS